MANIFETYVQNIPKDVARWLGYDAIGPRIEKFEKKIVNRNFRMRLMNRPTEIDQTWLHVPSGILGPPAVTLTKWFKCLTSSK